MAFFTRTRRYKKVTCTWQLFCLQFSPDRYEGLEKLFSLADTLNLYQRPSKARHLVLKLTVYFCQGNMIRDIDCQYLIIKSDLVFVVYYLASSGSDVKVYLSFQLNWCATIFSINLTYGTFNEIWFSTTISEKFVHILHYSAMWFSCYDIVSMFEIWPDLKFATTNFEMLEMIFF